MVANLRGSQLFTWPRDVTVQFVQFIRWLVMLSTDAA